MTIFSKRAFEHRKLKQEDRPDPEVTELDASNEEVLRRLFRDSKEPQVDIHHLEIDE